MTRARSELVPTETTLYHHCVGRCVRRALLCGEDFASGRSYEHRKRWITRRLRHLEEAFAVSVGAYAVTSNHYHLVLRLEPHEAEASDHTSVQQRIREARGRARRALPDLLPLQAGDDGERNPEALPLPLPAYLELVDATGRAVRQGKRGAIPKDLPPILQRIGMEPRSWLRFLRSKGEGFYFAIGPVDELRAFSEEIQAGFLKGLAAARSLFPT